MIYIIFRGKNANVYIVSLDGNLLNDWEKFCVSERIKDSAHWHFYIYDLQIKKNLQTQTHLNGLRGGGGEKQKKKKKKNEF